MSRSYQQDRWLRETPQTLASRTIGEVHVGGTKYPVLPIFPGLALDILFYAIAWWAIIVMPGAIKRWHRRRTGRCIGCGYDLAGLAAENGARTCPECGAIDRARSRAPVES